MAGSINLIKASDGTGNAATATVQSPRSPGATTLSVDTVENIPATFIGTMGTPHTFTDPITSEVITVISEASAVDFVGHVSSTHLEIDTIAPGYTDGGSEVDDIIIIKPTTTWANNLADVLDVSLNDDGTLKTGIVSNSKLASDISPEKFANPYKFSVYQSSSQSIASLGTSKITLDTKIFDTGANFDVATNHRFTAPVAGYYFFHGSVQISNAGMSTGAVGIALLYKNASEYTRGVPSVGTGNANNLVASQVSVFVQLAANDYIELYAYNGDSSIRNTGASLNLTYLSGFLVSAT